MNASSKILILTCTLLLVAPISIMACDPDCVDCYYWNGEYCEPLSGVSCHSWTDCPNGGWCCDCLEPDCQCVQWDYWCGDPWYGPCYYCSGCGCVCGIVTSVSGASGTYCLGDSVTVTANGNFSGGCPITWSGPGYFSNIEGSSATITFTVTGANLRIMASSGCQQVPTWSSPFNVVGVASVSPSNAHCWDGGRITFSATPDPSGVGFPAGQPVWMASAGSFPSGNTGPNVTWQAPSGTGGYATITATCGSSNANDTVSYGFVSIGGSGGDLLRSASDVFYATVQPPDFPVSFAQDSSTSPHLSVNPLYGVAIEVDNLILASDAQAWVDTALAGIKAIVPGLSIKVFGRTYNLKKRVSDWADVKMIPDTERIYGFLEDFAESQAGGRAYDAVISSGFNSGIASYARDVAKTSVRQGFSNIYPFPATVTDSIINESRTYSGNYSLSLTTGGLSFQLLPSFEPPGDIGAWIRSINEHGFTGVLTGLETGPKVTLNVSASGVDWSAGFSASLDFYDNYGHCGFSFTANGQIWLH